jgi:hypothetical protein
MKYEDNTRDLTLVHLVCIVLAPGTGNDICVTNHLAHPASVQNTGF